MIVDASALIAILPAEPEATHGWPRETGRP